MPSSARRLPHPRSFPPRRSSDLDQPAIGQRKPEPAKRNHGAQGRDQSIHAQPDDDQSIDRAEHQADGNGGGQCPQDRHFPIAHQDRSEEHTSELQSLTNLVCRLLPVDSHIPARSLHDALPISISPPLVSESPNPRNATMVPKVAIKAFTRSPTTINPLTAPSTRPTAMAAASAPKTGTSQSRIRTDRKSTRLNSSL